MEGPVEAHIKLSKRLCTHIVVVELFSCLVMTFERGGVTTCKFVRILPLFLLCLPTPTRTRNEGARPYFDGPEGFNEHAALNEY